MTWTPETNRIMWCLMTPEEQAAMKAAKHGWEIRDDYGWIGCTAEPVWFTDTTYRAIPAPAAKPPVDHAIWRFTPTRENSTCDGSKWNRASVLWDDLDWPRKEWREKSVWSHFTMQPDPHWLVPHKDGDTHHRVRPRRPATSPRSVGKGKTMTEEIKSRLNWLYAVEGTEKERAALLAIHDLASAWALE
jgi:hypothetical protein